METKILEVGGFIGGLFIVWKILQVVLDYRKQVKQPVVQNGQASRLMSTLDSIQAQMHQWSDSQNRVLTSLETVSSSLSSIGSMLAVQAEQHKRLLDEIRDLKPTRRKR